MIEINHLRKEYPNVVPLSDVNATINDGDIISIIGPSGTGKSTLIRCINLLEKPTSGQIICDGIDITSNNVNSSDVCKKIGMVFQNFNLFPNITIIENIMLAPRDILKVSKQKAYDRAMELLHIVGLESKASSYPDELSGGQKQRVAIARTLAMNPDVILFDEPTSALDPTMTGEVESVIRDLAKMGKTMMIVTHEMKFAREISNRVFYMDQGIIYEDGTPEQIFDNPQKDRTRRFIQQLKVFEAEIKGREFDFPGASSSLERYGYKNQMPAKTLYRIQSVFEELCEQILLEHYENPNILFTAEYSSKEDRAICVISYGGELFDPNTTANTLALSFVKSNVESMEYSVQEESELKNRIELKIR